MDGHGIYEVLSAERFHTRLKQFVGFQLLFVSEEVCELDLELRLDAVIRHDAEQSSKI